MTRFSKSGQPIPIMYGATPRKRFNVQERRKRIIAMIGEDPGITQGQMAEALNIDRSTVSRDLKTLSEELKIQNQEGWLVHRERVLHELNTKQSLCEDRLKRLEKHPHQGSRWLEEWRKLKDMESKILGLYAPDRLLIKEEQTFDKTETDASIDAAIAAASFDDSIIDITPQIEHDPDTVDI
jgi:predicted transcriptional regulator